MKIFQTLFVCLFLSLLSAHALSQQVVNLTCNSCSTSVMDLKVEGFVMQHNLDAGDYIFIVVDSKTMDLHRLDVNVERSVFELPNEEVNGLENAEEEDLSDSPLHADIVSQDNVASLSGIDLDIIVTINHLPLTTNLQEVETLAKTAKSSLDEKRRTLTEISRPVFRIPANSGYPSATYALSDPVGLGLTTSSLLTDRLHALAAYDSFADAAELLRFKAEHGLDSVISNALNLEKVISYTVEFSDGTRAQVDVTLAIKAQFGGLKKLEAHAHYTRVAWFANEVRIPVNLTQLENLGSVDQNMVGAAGVAALIAYFNVPTDDPGGLLSSPSTGRLDYCIRIIDYIEDPFTGRKVAYVAKDCND